jgi:hypothetical protein
MTALFDQMLQKHRHKQHISSVLKGNTKLSKQDIDEIFKAKRRQSEA